MKEEKNEQSEKIFSNINKILLSIINDLKQVTNYTKENLVINKIIDIILKINNLINEKNVIRNEPKNRY